MAERSPQIYPVDRKDNKLYLAKQAFFGSDDILTMDDVGEHQAAVLPVHFPDGVRQVTVAYERDLGLYWYVKDNT